MKAFRILLLTPRVRRMERWKGCHFPTFGLTAKNDPLLVLKCSNVPKKTQGSSLSIILRQDPKVGHSFKNCFFFALEIKPLVNTNLAI